MLPETPAAEPRNRFAILALALLLPWSALLQPVHPINHDVSWFFYVARGVLRGGTLYRDFIEPNAPLASLSLVPAVWLTRVPGIGPGLAVELVVLAIASVAMLLCTAVLWRLRIDLPRLLFVLLALAFAFAFLPKANFGQREHILAMLFTPYALACAARIAGVPVGPALGGVLGAAAAVAVVLKPPFILVPAALETAQLLRMRWQWRPDTALTTLAACVTLMAVGTVVFFPLYASTVVPWAAVLYTGYNQPAKVARITFGLLAAAAIVWLGWGQTHGATARAMRNCLGAAMVAALAAYAVQCKGWVYQAFPAISLLFVLNAGAVATTPLWPGRSPAAWARWLPPRAVLAAFAYYFVVSDWTAVNTSLFADAAQDIAAEPGPFLILSTNVVPAFPMALQVNRVWASRMPCLIMLPGLVKLEQHSRKSRWETTFRSWISQDLLRYQPNLVFVPLGKQQALPAGFDMLAWLQRDPAFSTIWSHYHQDGLRDGMRMFRRS